MKHVLHLRTTDEVQTIPEGEWSTCNKCEAVGSTFKKETCTSRQHYSIIRARCEGPGLCCLARAPQGVVESPRQHCEINRCQGHIIQL
eukprot:4694139-Prorocentrum_lima.AAC.1